MTILILSYMIIGVIIGIVLMVSALGIFGSFHKKENAKPIGRKIEINMALINLKSMMPGQYMVFKQDVDMGSATSMIDHDTFKIHNNFISALIEGISEFDDDTVIYILDHLGYIIYYIPHGTNRNPDRIQIAQYGDAPEPDSSRPCLIETTSRPDDLQRWKKT